MNDQNASQIPSHPVGDQLVSRPAFALSGTIVAPGDKSMSHRALIIGALANGTTRIDGLLEAQDVLATARALQMLGVGVSRIAEGQWTVTGKGTAGFDQPDIPLDFGNAGTGVRLGFGLVAGQNIKVRFTGDHSLSKRPMKRVLEPLAEMGAITSSHKGCLPVVVQGTNRPRAVRYSLKIASAQVKSALLLAGLGADGPTIIEEPGPSRDHTENLLRQFGAKLETCDLVSGGKRVTLHGPVSLTANPVSIPGDPSSAAFATLAALIVPGSKITITNVMTNPTRFGFFDTLIRAGYDIRIEPQHGDSEPVADLHISYGCKAPLRPPATLAVTMIDEYPAMMVLAAFAEGTSHFDGIGELRIKESDRILQMAALLKQNGVSLRTGKTWMEIDGTGTVFGPAKSSLKQQTFKVAGDHRIAMSALILAMGSFLPITVLGGKTIGTSYPAFLDDMNNLGARMNTVKPRNELVIAVDGPLASGKGTLAKRLAQELKLPYLDTGLLYRATARAALKAGISLEDEDQISILANTLKLPIPQTEELRTAEIGAAASKVAAWPKVRTALLALQQNFARQPGGAVLDGRDIGTIVCPNADIKFWVTASEQVRAKRRQSELADAGQMVEYDDMLLQLRERDARDAARKNAPMQKATNAYLIDTSKLSIDASLQVALKRVERMLTDRG